MLKSLEEKPLEEKPLEENVEVTRGETTREECSGKRSGERKRPAFHLPRLRTICVQPDKHQQWFKGSLGENAERDGAERIGAFLSTTMQSGTETKTETVEVAGMTRLESRVHCPCLLIFRQTLYHWACGFQWNLYKMMVTMTMKGVIQDFLQSSHCTMDCLQYICSSGHCVIVCKSCSVHWVLFMCSMRHATWYEGAAQLLSLTDMKSHVF